MLLMKFMQEFTSYIFLQICERQSLGEKCFCGTGFAFHLDYRIYLYADCWHVAEQLSLYYLIVAHVLDMFTHHIDRIELSLPRKIMNILCA